jgi:hypothetical protein
MPRVETWPIAISFTDKVTRCTTFSVASHSLPQTELKTIQPGELAERPDQTILDRWKKELNFDWEMEVGRVLQKVAHNGKIKPTDKAKILIQGATVVKTMRKESVNGAQPPVQVNIMTVPQLTQQSEKQVN